MPTNKQTIDALERLVRHLEQLGVKSADLTALKRHIGQQKRQPAWSEEGGKWRYGKK